HYEISNFAKPGYASRHNLHYWNYDDFYGVGLGASGKLSSFRYDNTRNFQEYFKGHWIGETIELSRRDQMFERVMMNLRTARGVSLADFEQKFGLPLSEVYPDAVQKGIRQGWLRMTEDCLVPTEAGMALLNTVLEEFLD
ncbi:MAG: coproporphyrinogen III oxidase, partial [Holdemania filiformis]